MKTIYNETDKNEILGRIEKLTPESKALWGKMNVAQMLAHSAKALQMAWGEVKTKNSPMQIIGQFFKKPFVRGEKLFGQNAPTSPEIKIIDKKEFQVEKVNFISAVNKAYTDGAKGPKVAKHAFFGKMTSDDWGLLGYKHSDHHLRQFGV